MTKEDFWLQLVSFSTHSSLCNYLRENSTDLPLVPVDDETERLIWEKDDEVRRLFTRLRSPGMVGVRGVTFRLPVMLQQSKSFEIGQ